VTGWTSFSARWETAALELRRTFSWALRSPFYSNWECFVLLWSQLGVNCDMPFQSFPFQVAVVLPLIYVKSYVTLFVFGKNWEKLCSNDNCVLEFSVKSFHGDTWDVALPLALVIFFSVLLFYAFLMGFDFALRCCTTRYRPRCMWLTYYVVLKGFCSFPFFIYAQYWALHDYCWGGAEFKATARSPLSSASKPQQVANGPSQPLLQRGEP